MQRSSFRSCWQFGFCLLSLNILAACGGGGADSAPTPQPTPQNVAPVPGTNTFQLNGAEVDDRSVL